MDEGSIRKQAEADIKRIDEELESGNRESQWKLFVDLDGRYQACIANFHLGMMGASSDGAEIFMWRIQERPAYVIENLRLIKGKLSSFIYGANVNQSNTGSSTEINVNTNISVSISFDDVRQRIEDMTSLSRSETDEIKERIDELEKILNSEGNKKTKWEKVRPILVWLADKSVDVAIALLPLFLKING